MSSRWRADARAKDDEQEHRRYGVSRSERAAESRHDPTRQPLRPRSRFSVQMDWTHVDPPWGLPHWLAAGCDRIRAFRSPPRISAIV